MPLNHKNHQFVLAVKSDDFATVRTFLQDPSINLDYCLPTYGTALHAAIVRRNIRMVRTLLSHGAKAEPDLPSDLLSPLWSAVVHNHYEISYVLIDAGADVNKSYNVDYLVYLHIEGTTLLHAAALAKNGELMKRLLKAGADANSTNCKSESVLQLAIDTGCTQEIIHTLLEHGASAAYSTKAGRSVLHYAIRSGRSSLTGLLMDYGADPLDVHCSGKTSLYFAADAKVENARIAEMLIDEGVDIDAPDRITLCTPLHVAVNTRKEKLVEVLLEHGADVGLRNRGGYSALCLAVENGTVKTVESLLVGNADPNETVLGTSTILHLACTIGCEHKIRLLLEHGADVNLVDRVGRTPLLMIRNLDSRAAVVMVKHFIYLSNRDPRLISRANWLILMGSESLRRIYDGCVAEIEKMKRVKVYDGITYYRMLTKDDARLARLLRNDDLTENLEWLEYDCLFPYHAHEIGEKLRRAKGMRDSRKVVEECLMKIFGSCLPSLVIETLADFVRKDDLRLE